MLRIWLSGRVVKNTFRIGTLRISWRKSDKSRSASCSSHSSRASMSMRMVDPDAFSQLWRGWMIRSRSWSWSCLSLASGLWSRASPIRREIQWLQRRASLIYDCLHSSKRRSWRQANRGYTFLVQPSSWPLISRYQLNHPDSIFEILNLHTTNIYLSKPRFVYLQSK